MRDAVHGHTMEWARHGRECGERPHHVRRHLPAPLLGRPRAGHQPGVEARAATDGEIMRTVGALHAAQVDGRRAAGQDDARRRRRIPWQPQVTDEEVPGAARYQSEWDAAPHRAGGDLHGRAVAPIADEGIEPLGLRFAGEAPRDRKSTRLNSSHGYISYAVF